MTSERRVLLLKAAREDLDRLARESLPLAKCALVVLKKLEAGRLQGRLLDDRGSTGDLPDCRKLYFGLAPSLDSHRIVYKRRPNGDVEILEIVAVETREESYAYLLAAQRLGRLPESRRWWLSRVAARLGRSDPVS